MRKATLIVLVLIAAILPLSFPQYWLHVAIISLYYVMLAASWNLLAGFTGQVSFAHAAFAGLGAYVSGLLATRLGVSPWLGLIVAPAVAAVIGLMLGRLCIKMGGIYLSLTTLGFSEILRLVLVNEDNLTRGTMGLQLPGLFSSYSKAHTYLVVLTVTTLMLWLIQRTLVSDTGLAFRSVLNDETAAAASGIDTRRIRLQAFAWSAAAAGLAGALYGHYLMIITPDMASQGQMFLILAMAVIGGLGSFVGPIIGAVALTVLAEKMRAYGEYHRLIFGLATLAMIRFAPRGLIWIFRRRGG